MAFGPTASFKGVDIGYHAWANFQVVRQPVLKHIPRCHGVRIKDDVSGAQLEIAVTAWKTRFATRTLAEQHLITLRKQMGTGSGALSVNGIEYTKCQMVALDSDGSDTRHIQFICVFRQTLY